MKYARFITFLLVPLLCGISAAESPTAEISNGQIQATFHLPDPNNGYYRGTRFEWSGVIQSLRYKDHEYFGVWFPVYDPKLHDAITGPVEEFRTRGESSVGYDQAKPGETFLRIGVGTLKKPDAKPYQIFGTYEIVDSGKWSVTQGDNQIVFTHELTDSAGYGYLYTKLVRLEPDRPEMVIYHFLKNTGKLPIETLQYNHNFFVIDNLPTGPDVTLSFPFEARASSDLGDKAKVAGKQLTYKRKLQKSESVYTEIQGFGATAADYDFRIENRKAGAGVRIVGDRPLAKLVFWSISSTVCPEPYVDIKVAPGEETNWAIRYTFYTLPTGGN